MKKVIVNAMAVLACIVCFLALMYFIPLWIANAIEVFLLIIVILLGVQTLGRENDAKGE